MITEEHKCLVHVETTIVLGQPTTWRGDRKALITDGRTCAAFERERDAFAGVGHARHEAGEEISILGIVNQPLGEVPV